MNKYKLSKNLPQIPINENYKEKIFSLASSHELAELEDFITTNSISLKIKNEDNETITHVLLKGENTTPENELLRCIKFLVERGAPISSIDKDYLTPLFICIKKKYSEIFKYLLSQHANTDIKTYDNLNVLHEIAKPEHTIFDVKSGIQDLIPERLPKITMEGYKDVYNEIQTEVDKVNKVDKVDEDDKVDKVDEDLIKVNEDLKTFGDIAKQFYDIDNDNKEEDFNNKLLIEKAIKEPNNIYTVKNELFEKLKNKLSDNDNEEDENEDEDEEYRLNESLNRLNTEINKDKMQNFNSNLELSILNLAENLELCIYYFFLNKPANTNIAIEVIIALVKYIIDVVPVGGAPPLYNVQDIRQVLDSPDLVRQVLFAMNTASKETPKKEKNNIQDIINIIRNAIFRHIAPVGAPINNGAFPVFFLNAGNSNFQQFISSPPAAVIGISNSIRLSVNTAMNIVVNIPTLPGVVDHVLNHGAAGLPPVGQIQNNIRDASTHARNIVLQVNFIQTEINTAISRIPAVILAIAPADIPDMELKVLAVLQTAMRATLHASVYARNEVLALPGGAGAGTKIANISAVYAVVDANVLEQVLNGFAGFQARVNIQNINQDQLQELLHKELSDQNVAIEAIVQATQQIAIVIQSNIGAGGSLAPINPDIVIKTIKEALESIGASKNNIKTIIDLANKAASEDADDAAKRLAIINIFTTNINAVREVILAINAASKVKDINENKTVIENIRKLLVDEVAAAAAAATVRGDAVTTGTGTPIGTVMGTIQDNAEDKITNFIIDSLKIQDNEAKEISTEIQNKINEALILPELPGVVDNVLNHGAAGGPPPVGLIQNNITSASTHAIIIVQEVYNIKTEINTAITTILVAIQAIVGPGPAQLPQTEQLSMELKVLAVLQTAMRATLHAAVYARNEVFAIPVGGTKIANISAVYAVVDANVLEQVLNGFAGFQARANIQNINQDQLQELLQKELSDQNVAIESIVIAAQQIAMAIIPGGGGGGVGGIANITKEIVMKAIEEALRIPPIVPQQFKSEDYNELIKDYKLINIPQKYINYNLSYNIIDTYENKIKPKVDPKDYQLTENKRIYAIDYFNLLYTFNQYVKNYYNPVIVGKDNIFTLYQNIQQIYKYKYIIYIFNKQKEKIQNLLIGFTPINNINLVDNIKNIFTEYFNNLNDNVKIIEGRLSEIIKLANECIKSFNNFNASKIDMENSKISIGIYPEIKLFKYDKIEYTLYDENEIIANYCRDNYVKYNKYKQIFFHNFVLFFQDIGQYDSSVSAENNKELINEIPKRMDYKIVIDNNYKTNNNKNKAYKLYFYNPKYLKKHIQKNITKLLNIPKIKDIGIEKFKYNKLPIKQKYTNEIKKTILKEILEEKFNSLLEIEINNFFKAETGVEPGPLVYTPNIQKPNIQEIILKSVGFNNILIPNYEFKNNKFYSISKNKFLQCILYFDTNYFKQTNLKEIKYYKDNKFIDNILEKELELFKKKDIKGWSPIYYAIDGNNFKVIQKMLSENQDILKVYDYKKISPLRLCINKQLQHLNYLLNDDNSNHFLNNYIVMLRDKLKSNDVLIPLNIDAVFIIALVIQNNIFDKSFVLPTNKKIYNSRKKQINEKYNSIDTGKITDDNDKFKNSDDNIHNELDKIERKYDNNKKNDNYNYNDDEKNTILKEYYDKAKGLEKENFGLYGSYWIRFSEYNNNYLDHIKVSNRFKKLLTNLIELEKVNTSNIPEYNSNEINNIYNKLNSGIKIKLVNYLNFINIRFNTNKDNAYNIFLSKIYVHVLANIIGVDFYLRMEELIINYYISSDIDIDNTVKNQLILLNKLLINNKLDKTNINYLYITEEQNPELVLKNNIKEFIESNFLANSMEIINIFETKVFPNYRDLYKITYEYLQMFISNYHKFIYNQYHRLDILLLLLDKLT